MGNLSLDQWGVITPTNTMEKPLILSDDHAEYLIGKFCPKVVEDKQIESHLEEEKLENERLMKIHQEYIEKNYVRVGEANGKN